MSEFPWQRPLGARPAGDGRVEFRVWAPQAERVEVRVAGVDQPLADAGYGVREGVIEASPGDDYWFVLDGEAWPDPCSRFQPEGLRGPSRVVDPDAFGWSDAAWAGVPLQDAVIYELHVGTFTAEGTFDGAIEHLPALADLGVNVIELMPIADFPGRRGWGYDGVYLHAAHEAYGGPDGLMRLVDAAHAQGIAVVLDLVLNHLGASGATAFEAFGPYFTERYSTFWGEAINYDDADSDPVREWAVQCAEGWVRDFHLDGLRLDAIHAIFDTSATHVLALLADRVHAANPRALVIAESGLNDPKVMRPRDLGGYGHDAAWADDFHHALRVLLTGDRDGYYEDFGEVAQLAKAFRRPHVHDGDWSPHRRRMFGAPAFDRPPEQFVVFSQNHDQVGNRAFGDRMPDHARPLAAMVTLLAPFTPMLWMGEEYGERAPFQFFTDHIDEEIATATREGRRREFASFATFADEVPDPQAVETFEASRLTRDEAPGMRGLYRALLALRRALGRVEAEPSFDEDAGWLRVRLGHGHELVCNLSDHEQTVTATDPTEIVLATHEGAALRDGAVVLPALGGAVVR